MEGGGEICPFEKLNGDEEDEADTGDENVGFLRIKSDCMCAYNA